MTEANRHIEGVIKTYSMTEGDASVLRRDLNRLLRENAEQAALKAAWRSVALSGESVVDVELFEVGIKQLVDGVRRAAGLRGAVAKEAVPLTRSEANAVYMLLGTHFAADHPIMAKLTAMVAAENK